MEVGPTTHYIMGGVRVDADTQMSTVPGLFAAGECAAGINGANRLGGNSLSDLLVFGKRAGEYAAKYREGADSARPIDTRQVDEAARRALEPFERGAERRGPVSGAVRAAGDDAGPRRASSGTRPRCSARSTASAPLRERANRVGVGGHREYNPGWHTALDLHNLLTVSEAITRSALERKESRGGHFRDDYPGQGRRVRRRSTSSSARAPTARWRSRARRFRRCRRS